MLTGFVVQTFANIALWLTFCGCMQGLNPGSFRSQHVLAGVELLKRLCPQLFQGKPLGLVGPPRYHATARLSGSFQAGANSWF